MISILIPFKNTAPFLPACLNSIIDQGYREWEVIAVDDHSSDESATILAAYAENDSRIRWIPNQGNGIIQALRTAYKASHGGYLTRMDSDDIMAQNKLAVLRTKLDHHGYGHLATGQVRYFSETGISDGYARYERWINQLTATGSNFTDIYKECVIPSPCWMVHRRDFEQCGGFSHDRYPEDYDLAFRFYQHGLKVIPCAEILHHWRDYPTRTSRTSEHYALNYFLDIKLHYFLEIDREPKRPLVIWGAGGKGKSIAKALIQQNRTFVWLCDNPNKIGKKIYGVELKPYQTMATIQEPQSIITVANEEAQAEIQGYLHGLGMTQGVDFFLFC